MAWKKVKLGEILLKYENYIELEGLVLRCNKFGQEIGSKKQNQIKSNLFLISKIDARNGAWGVVPDFLEGAIITNSFLAYQLSEEVSIEWFNLYMKNPDFIRLCISLSEGTTNRKTLNVKKFMDTEIKFPDLKTQKQIVDKFNKLKSKNFEETFQNQQTYIKKLRESILSTTFSTVS
jgi:type I restriction enzyme S subunit